MKRQSKAEEALRAQVKIIQGQMDECEFQIKELQIRRSTLHEMRNRIESDISRLKKAREEMSIRNANKAKLNDRT